MGGREPRADDAARLRAVSPVLSPAVRLDPQTVVLTFTSNLKHAFASWSDGGARTHNITAPASPATYQATLRLCWLLDPC